ncbi:MAG: hypothetical protein J6K29_12650 [Clostridia bacterium]|nr:hypothetical protein [Clostridia bacterium]MBP3667884.1 hypothetical protein [Clostridia bacterium]
MKENNEDHHNTESRAELMLLVRDAALNGEMTAADIYELADLARSMLGERDGTPEAVSA